jgi:peptide/nickel transport system permease protein
MGRYLGRRLLQSIPTVLGVVLLTFVLFNVVGGSPAAMVLGKNATAKELETFDEQRGLNKPLLIGRWARTRALDDADFAVSAAGWPLGPGVKWSSAGTAGGACLAVTATQAAVPLAFGLRSQTAYRWRLRYRLAGNAAAEMVLSIGGAPAARCTLPPTDGWRAGVWDLPPAAGMESGRFQVNVECGTLELRRVELRRRTAGWWDSQFVFYLRQLTQLDFGVSTATNQKVGRMLRSGLTPSLLLTVPIFVGSLALAIVLALVCAYARNSWLDRSLVVLAVALMSINYLVWIIAGQYLFSYRLGWFPIWGFESWRYLALPVLIGMATGLGGNLRFYRTVMLDEMYRDYVRTALAKGLTRRQVLFKHVLKNALIPIVTNTVIAIPFLYTGSLLLESFFGIPGLGGLSVNAINSADVDVVRAVVLIGAALYVAANLLTDVCYALVDPRVRLR